MKPKDRYEYLVEWDHRSPSDGFWWRETQIYASNAALVWAIRRFEENKDRNPTMKRRLVNPWEDMPLDSLSEVG